MTEYDEKNIRIFEWGTQHVRACPAMYYGDYRKAIHELCFQLIYLGINLSETYQSSCDHIAVRLYSDGKMTVVNNGTGLLTKLFDQDSVLFERIMTQFAYPDYHILKKGVKIGDVELCLTYPIINGFSEYFTAEVKNTDKGYRQSYTKGIPITPVEVIYDLDLDEPGGTCIQFLPDATYFDSIHFDFQILAERFDEIVTALPGLKILLRDERENPPREVEFYYLAES